MWLPVAVAMPMPAKLPITRANIESFCEAKMPVARARGRAAQQRARGTRGPDIEQQDGGDEAEGGDRDPALTLVPNLDQPTHSWRSSAPGHAGAPRLPQPLADRCPAPLQRAVQPLLGRQQHLRTALKP